MHYYQFNIGDYHSHTSRLSIYEDIAYRRLLDLYYLNERPLNGCSTDIAREIGMIDSLGDVEYVLNKFFTEKNGEWMNKRCDEEIKAFHSKKKSARKAGIASAKARNKKRTDVERPLNGKVTDVQPTNNHKQITINKDKTLMSSKLDEIEVLNFLNEKTGRNYQPVKSNLSMIKARLKEYSITQLNQVIAKKCRDWGADEKMEPYLRPATLFNATKCAQYVGELGQVKEHA